MVKLLWPRIFCNTKMFPPLVMKWLAKVWRNTCVNCPLGSVRPHFSIAFLNAPYPYCCCRFQHNHGCNLARGCCIGCGLHRVESGQVGYWRVARSVKLNRAEGSVARVLLPNFMSSFDAWYLMLFAFGMLCAWAAIKGLSE